MARLGNKNKQVLSYSLYVEGAPIYVTDDDGNTMYDEDGEPLETGQTKNGYDEPVEFKANIAFSSGEAEAETFGVSVSSYDSKIIMLREDLPIDETSIIFQDSEPEYDDDGYVVENSADFRVVKVAPSLNYKVYLLKRIEK